MNTFDLLKFKNRKRVIEYGKALATDKSGFVKFANNNWTILNGDYVRAVVASAELLIDRPDDWQPIMIADELYRIQQTVKIENNEKAICQAMEKYFDNGQRVVTDDGLMPEISSAYRFKIKTYLLSKTLEKELEKLAPSVKPLLSDDVVAMLKSYDQHTVILSLYRKDRRSAERVYNISIQGKRPKDLTLTFKDKEFSFSDESDSVALIRDAETGDVVYQNTLHDVKFDSEIERELALCGYNEVAELYENKLHLLQEDDELYRCKNQGSQKFWKSIDRLKKKNHMSNNNSKNEIEKE